MTQDDNGNTWLQGWCVRKGVTYRYYNYGLDYTADAVYTNLHLCLSFDGSSLTEDVADCYGYVDFLAKSR